MPLSAFGADIRVSDDVDTNESEKLRLGSDTSARCATHGSTSSYIPPEILGMIFKEYLLQPAAHFIEAHLSVTQEPIDGLSTYTMTLARFAKADVHIGYDASTILSQTCHVGRDAVRSWASEQSQIRLMSGTVPVKATDDVVCLALPQPWKPSLEPDHMWEEHGRLPLDWVDIAEKLGNLHNVGLLVTTEMWHNVLRDWFTPRSLRETDYCEEDGRLCELALGHLMACFPSLEKFCLVLADTTAEDWNEFYHEFPITFHDHTGSYAEVYWQPIHPAVLASLCQLWESHHAAGENDLGLASGFPYSVADEVIPNINLDATFPQRVDAQMENKTRVAFLVGLLERASLTAEQFRDGQVDGYQKPEYCILVRKPDDPAFFKARDINPIPTELTLDEEYVYEPEPADLEETWVTYALKTIEAQSAVEHEMDKMRCQE